MSEPTYEVLTGTDPETGALPPQTQEWLEGVYAPMVTDAQFAAAIEDDASATQAALNGAYATRPTQRAAVVTGSGRQLIGIEDGADGFVFGINLGLTNAGSPSYTNWWTIDWSDAWVDANMARIANLGANVVRVTGQYTAYALDTAAFKTKMQYAIESARSHGLKVMYSLLNVGVSGEELIDPSSMNLYEAMIDDLVTPYIGDPVIFAWDALNDGRYATISNERTIGATLVPYIRSVDPTALVTTVGSTISDCVRAEVLAVVDFVGLNYYILPTVYGTWYATRHNEWNDPGEVLRTFTAKPVIITEWGANSAASGNEPQTKNEWAHAHYLASMRKHLARSNVAGAFIHKIIDPPSGNLFGLYNADGTPKRAAAEALLFPTQRLRAATDYTDARPRTIVADNFGRADSTSTAGTSPLGGAPTARTGTWGISTRRAYVHTSGGSNTLTWATNTADVEVSAEFEGAGAMVVGIILRWTDASNLVLVRYSSVAGTIVITEVTAGSSGTTTISSIPTNFQFLRLSATAEGNQVRAYLNGILVGGAQLNSQLTAANHGVNISVTGGDAGSKVTGVDMGVVTRRM